MLILCGEQQSQVAFAPDEFVLLCGTAFEDAHQVFDTFLPGFDNFLNTNFVWDMTDNGQALFMGFRCSGEVSIVCNNGLDFDEVHALCFEPVHGSNRTGRSSNGDGTREAQFPVRQIPVQHGAGDDHAWTDGLAVRDLFAPLREYRNLSAHITHAGYTVGDEKRQMISRPPGNQSQKAECTCMSHIPGMRY
ncbi:MAG TPA: hypothetical protein VM912_21270 [Terriglobales bacterium]|nr:hypothetical protein [Terriglobales bacterium]